MLLQSQFKGREKHIFSWFPQSCCAAYIKYRGNTLELFKPVSVPTASGERASEPEICAFFISDLRDWMPSGSGWSYKILSCKALYDLCFCTMMLLQSQFKGMQKHIFSWFPQSCCAAYIKYRGNTLEFSVNSNAKRFNDNIAPDLLVKWEHCNLKFYRTPVS